MSKRACVFLVGIAAVLVTATALFFIVNNSLISPYYLYKQKQELGKICEKLSLDAAPLAVTAEYLEENNNIVIAMVLDSEDVNDINDKLRREFLSKGLGVVKYWLWGEDYEGIKKNGTQQRVYGQGRLGYSLLVQYIIKDKQIAAVATVVPHLSRPLAIISTFSVAIMGAGSILLMILAYKMSVSLEKTQQNLAIKNQEMVQLINHVSHDLKTPIALIKAYTSGMRDGIDDGTFLDTITQQNQRMEELTLRLLEMSRYEKATLVMQRINISELLLKQIKIQERLFAHRDISIVRNIQNDVFLQANEDAVETIFENLLSNAAKYASASPVQVLLYKKGKESVLEIKNPTELSSDTKLDRLWEAFYVAEASRNSKLCGSGLGLSLVRSAANSISATTYCEIIQGELSVIIKFKKM